MQNTKKGTPHKISYACTLEYYMRAHATTTKLLNPLPTDELLSERWASFENASHVSAPPSPHRKSQLNRR